MSHRGAIMLEALVALALAGGAAAAVVPLMVAILRSDAGIQRRQRQIIGADQLLAASQLWSTRELLLRLGARSQGEYVLRIRRDSPTLFTIDVLDQSGAHLLLTTRTLRPGARVIQ